MKPKLNFWELIEEIVRRLPGGRFKKKCLVPTVKHGGGIVMVWGEICTNGVALLKRIVDIMGKRR